MGHPIEDFRVLIVSVADFLECCHAGRWGRTIYFLLQYQKWQSSSNLIVPADLELLGAGGSYSA